MAEMAGETSTIGTENPNAKKLSENADSYLTEAHQKGVNKKFPFVSPQHCDGVDENEKSDNAAHQEGRMLITGRLKVMDHRDTLEHDKSEELTGKQLDSTFEELNSLGLFYIEAGPSIAHN